MTYKQMMQDAFDQIEATGATIESALVEYTNHPGTTFDADCDVWDGRGHWWTDDRKDKFCAWVDANYPKPQFLEITSENVAKCAAPDGWTSVTA